MLDIIKKRLNFDIVDIVALSGGLNNRLYKINNKYVYRHFDNYANYEEMIKIILLISNIYPTIHFIFNNAILEDYISLDVHDHTYFIDNIDKYIPLIDYIHKFERNMENKDLQILCNINPVLSKLFDWTLTLNINEDIKNYIHNTYIFNNFDLKFNKCLCHNDLHWGNFLSIDKIIDFEYSGINYEIYDWANFVNEIELKPNDVMYIIYPNPDLVQKIITKHNYNTTHFNFFRQMSDLFWYCWAIEKSTQPKINSFNYKAYAELRLNLFFTR